MSSVTCISCLRTVTKSESRPIEDGENKIIGRTCQSCRNEAVRLRCSAVKCKTPQCKIKYLKSVPQSVGDLPTEKRNSFLQNEFGRVALSGNLRCCAACYVRLHRLPCNKENSALVIIQPSPPSTSVKNSVGRPPSRFENASKRTQRRIKKNIKICTKQKIDELKADVEKMGASYEEICKEILETEFEKERQVGKCLQ